MPLNTTTTAAPEASRRKDLVTIKQQLADALGDNGPLYWKALTEFVTGKLNRQEFDFYAHLYIPAAHVYLHNAFILATIHNAHRDDVPPPLDATHRPVEWSRTTAAEAAAGDDQVINIAQQQANRRQKLKNLLKSMSKTDRRMLRQLYHKSDGVGGDSTLMRAGSLLPPPPPLLLPPETCQAGRRPILPIPMDQLLPTTVADYARGVQAPLCSDHMGIPPVDALRDRLTAISLEHGLVDGVTNECIEIILLGLDAHLRNVVSNCITKIRSNRTFGIRTETAPSSAASLSPDLTSVAGSGVGAPKPSAAATTPIIASTSPGLALGLEPQHVHRPPIMTNGTGVTALNGLTAGLLAPTTTVATSSPSVPVPASNASPLTAAHLDPVATPTTTTTTSNATTSTITTTTTSPVPRTAVPGMLHPTQTTLRLSDILFSLDISPHVLTEIPLSVERLAALPVYESESDSESVAPIVIIALLVNTGHPGRRCR
ncbi:transcriptional regulator of RNA polII, SAGA, subunit-domain-containing protein [Dimargaris cristalligena]|uniref:Transcriptional regulator of RNA polII, SAGA, subunit-domain-containing protein n=1 Tax=Dimargaris cristalligena TaxID=215637 RepID=A0A4P9ZRL7_9FUNG|nr:transcriptional regulator of RNA polII, SAGA, subunit-domain-containing protein [Dimargaris cristalligena]|eukprot:RKP35090.1 transcriptional regulator of RNA polII, SAGA, subunit-domain-containing protein [Dimargaris cristalligena]